MDSVVQRVSLVSLSHQNACNAHVPPFISESDSYTHCMCGGPFDCACGRETMTQSSAAFLWWCVEHLPYEVAYSLSYDDQGYIRVSAHIVGGQMNAPSMDEGEFPGSGHTHPFSAYCVQECYIGWASAEDLAYYLHQYLVLGKQLWGIVSALEGTYYYRPTCAPSNARYSDVKEALMHITHVWHTHRSTQSTPDNSSFRWSPMQYLQQMALLTWTRICSGACERSHVSGCIPVPKCGAAGDYPVFQVFFRPNTLTRGSRAISGLDLHLDMTRANVSLSCNTRSTMPRMSGAIRAFFFGCTDHQFGLVNEVPGSQACNMDWGQPIDPMHIMSRTEFITNRKSKLRFSLKNYSPGSWAPKAEQLGNADRNRRIDLYRISQPHRNVHDHIVADTLHMEKWWFNEWNMIPCRMAKSTKQEIILLTSPRHLKRYEILCHILAKMTHLYIEIHELPDHDANRMRLDGLCRPDELYWKDIDDRCTSSTEPTFDWNSTCKTICAGQTIFIRFGELEQMKTILYHEMAHLFHDMIWKPYGNHDDTFNARHRQIIQMTNNLNISL